MGRPLYIASTRGLKAICGGHYPFALRPFPSIPDSIDGMGAGPDEQLRVQFLYGCALIFGKETDLVAVTLDSNPCRGGFLMT